MDQIRRQAGCRVFSLMSRDTIGIVYGPWKPNRLLCMLISGVKGYLSCLDRMQRGHYKTYSFAPPDCKGRNSVGPRMFGQYYLVV